MLVYDSICGCCGCTVSQAHLLVRQVQGRRIGTYCTRCTASEYPGLAITASIAWATPTLRSGWGLLRSQPLFNSQNCPGEAPQIGQVIAKA